MKLRFTQYDIYNGLVQQGVTKFLLMFTDIINRGSTLCFGSNNNFKASSNYPSLSDFLFSATLDNILSAMYVV